MHPEAFLPPPIDLISEGGPLNNGSFVYNMLVDKSPYLHAAETVEDVLCPCEP